MANDQDDLKEAYEAYKAYKAFKGSQQQAPDTSGVINKVGSFFGADPIDWNKVREEDSAIRSGTAPRPKPVEGDVPMAMPMAAAPSAIQAIAGYLGKSGALPAAARVAANAGVGAIQGGIKDGAEGAKRGAIISGTLGAGSELLGGLLQAGKWGGRQLARMTKPQGEAYLQNPEGVAAMRDALEDPAQMPELQQGAMDAINNSRGQLKAKGLGNASKLRDYLSGKQVIINPNDYTGLDPRVDELLSKGISDATATTSGVENFKNGLAGVPDSIPMDANTVNQMKRYLQEGANFSPGTHIDPVQAAKVPQMASASHGLRSAIEQIAPEAAPLNQEMQQSVLLQKALRQGGKNPLAFVSSESPDRIATLAKVEKAGGGGLLDFGNQLGAAKTMTKPDHGSGVPTFLNKMGGRALMRGAQAGIGGNEASPVAIQAILQSLFSEPEKK